MVSMDSNENAPQKEVAKHLRILVLASFCDPEAVTHSLARLSKDNSLCACLNQIGQVQATY